MNIKIATKFHKTEQKKYLSGKNYLVKMYSWSYTFELN